MMRPGVLFCANQLRDFLNFPYAITPNFAAKHTSSLVIKKFVQDIKMNLNVAYNFASGRSVITGGGVAESGASKGKERVRALFVPGSDNKKP